MSPDRATDTPPRLADAAAALLPRLAVGMVFVVSGLLKFIYANQGAGRFARIGLPAPEVLASFVGTVEIVAGALVLAGLFARLAAVPLVIDMLVAITVTKLPLLWGRGPEPIAAVPQQGLWAFAYQARLDLAMLLLCVSIVMLGSGQISLDAWRARSRSENENHGRGTRLATH